jgi:hypothetical protein
VGSAGCLQAVLNQRGFILNYCEFERHDILTACGLKATILSGRAVYVLTPLQVAEDVVRPAPAVEATGSEENVVSHAAQVDEILRRFGRTGPGQRCEIYGDVIPATNPKHGPRLSWTVVFPDRATMEQCRPILESDSPGAFGTRAVSNVRRNKRTGEIEMRIDDVSLIRACERAAARYRAYP